MSGGQRIAMSASALRRTNPVEDITGRSASTSPVGMD
jgi:hypothetical protein